MPPKKRRNAGVTADPKRNPAIAKLQKQGLTDREIIDVINGRKDDQRVDRNQLQALGWNQGNIDRFMANQQRRLYPDRVNTPSPSNPGAPSSPGSGVGGGGGGAPAAPVQDPYEQYLAQLERDRKASAYSLMEGLLRQYGLDSLAGDLRNIIEGGITDQASIELRLQETDAWKRRFSGNEKLRANGLPVLSVAEYLATERTYAQILKNYGLPQGFYDDPSDFGDFIGLGVAPAELEDRMRSYSDLVNRDDPAVKAQLRAMGMNDGDLLAFYIDPERANPLIQRKYKATLIGAAARRTGLTPDSAYAERLAGMGITEQQAQAGYAVISESLDDVERLGEIYGLDYSQRDFEAEVFEGDATATRKRKRLASQERAAFSGSSGVGQGSLRRSTSGQF